MDIKTVRHILRLNHKFYELYADDFSNTRQAPWQGWNKLVPLITQKMPAILDIGCGNGRFYNFLSKRLKPPFVFVGIDQSKLLIRLANKLYTKLNNSSKVKAKANRFHNPSTHPSQAEVPSSRNLTHEVTFKIMDYLKLEDGLGAFDMIVGFGIMHHIPSLNMRSNILAKWAHNLKPGALLILTFWTQKPTNIAKTNLVLEKNDYITIWDKDPKKLRYVHVFNNQEIAQIKARVKKQGLTLIKEYSADGKDGKSNKYLIWQKL